MPAPMEKTNILCGVRGVQAIMLVLGLRGGSQGIKREPFALSH